MQNNLNNYVINIKTNNSNRCNSKQLLVIDIIVVYVINKWISNSNIIIVMYVINIHISIVCL